MFSDTQVKVPQVLGKKNTAFLCLLNVEPLNMLDVYAAYTVR